MSFREQARERRQVAQPGARCASARGQVREIAPFRSGPPQGPARSRCHFDRAQHRRRRRRVQKRSATETCAIVDILERRGQAPADQLQPIQDLIIRVVSMLTKLAAK
jgi:hypothetical protein